MDLRTVRKRCETTLRTVGVGYAAPAVLFAAGLPYAALLVGVRRGRFEDRHVRERAQRPALLAFTLASVAMGLVALRLLQAPRGLVAFMAALVAGMAITLLVSTVWKISGKLRTRSTRQPPSRHRKIWSFTFLPRWRITG